MSDAYKQSATQLAQATATPGWLDLVRAHAESIRFGTVLVTIHEGLVVQVETSEKLRLADHNRRQG